MSAVQYQVIPVDLATVRSAPGERIAGAGVVYDGITVLQLPVGATVALRFGDNRDAIPLLQQGQSFSFLDRCGHPYGVSESLFVENPAGAGTLILLISFAGSGGVSSQT